MRLDTLKTKTFKNIFDLRNKVKSKRISKYRAQAIVVEGIVDEDWHERLLRKLEI